MLTTELLWHLIIELEVKRLLKAAKGNIAVTDKDPYNMETEHRNRTAVGPQRTRHGSRSLPIRHSTPCDQSGVMRYIV